MARRQSTARVPSPTHIGFQPDVNGTTAASHPIFTYESSSAVRMWMARKTTDSRATLRCSKAVTRRGQPGRA